ncbi:MAG: hypothetical protein ACLRWQ_24090 [Flavonifractor plautii]
MFQGFSGATVDFMWGIRFNNEKGWFRGPQGGVPDHLSAAHEGAGRRGCAWPSTDRHPDPDTICKGVPHLPGRPAALRPRPSGATICG